MNPTQHLAQRKPQRISITLAHVTHEQLIKLSIAQGRSISNLAAFILERATSDLQQPPTQQRR
jgi:hypothetical protein